MNLENISDSHYDWHIVTADTQQKKKPITLLNEWAQMSDGGSNKKQRNVSYTLVAITGQAHKPIFTYVCQVHDITAEGYGFSKKEAKHNAAALLWESLIKIDYTANNSDKIITSTTNGDESEINKMNATNYTEGQLQIRNKIDSDEKKNELQYSKDISVAISYCKMNPVGALQELSMSYKWLPPFYNIQKLGHLRKLIENGIIDKMTYTVSCQVLHLQSIGVANTKKEAKRIAAHAMYKQISNIGPEKLNNLNQKPRNTVFVKNLNNNESSILLNDLQFPVKKHTSSDFQVFLSISMALRTDTLPNINKYLSLNKYQKIIYDQYKVKLEQCFTDDYFKLNSIENLHNLCQQLGFEATFVLMGLNEKNESIVLIQLNTIPITVTVGHAATVEMATILGAENILYMFKTMLYFNQLHLSNN